MPIEKKDYVVKNIPKYSLTKGINEKKYRNISEQVINNIPDIEDWLDEKFIFKNNLNNWNNSIQKLHKSENKSKSFHISFMNYANFLTLSENRKK